MFHLGGFHLVLEGNNISSVAALKSPFCVKSEKKNPAESNVTIQVCDGISDLAVNWNQVVDNDATWQLCESGDPQNKYRISPSKISELPNGELHLIADENFENLRIFYGGWRNTQPDLCLFYPFEQILMVHYLQFSKLGALVHASGVEIDGKGYLFLGDSGAGKSTIAELCEQRFGKGSVYSDDRIILREQNGKWWMYGTPWHGTLPRMNSSGLEVGGAFFIEKTPQFECERLNAVESFDRLLPVTFGTWWLPNKIQDMFSIAQKISGQVQFPLFRLGFAPNSKTAEKLHHEIQGISRTNGALSIFQ